MTDSKTSGGAAWWQPVYVAPRHPREAGAHLTHDHRGVVACLACAFVALRDELAAARPSSDELERLRERVKVLEEALRGLLNPDGIAPVVKVARAALAAEKEG